MKKTKNDRNKELVEFIKKNQDKNLSEIFKNFSKKANMAEGSVRNLYYKIGRLSNSDSQFCNQYLDGKPLKISKIKNFNPSEETELVEKILTFTKMGKSVRFAVNYLANNNSVIALRLQNKYRNLLKTNPTLIEKVKKELGIKEKKVEERDSLRHFNQFQILRVKKEINNLLDKTLDELKRENVALKNKVKELEEKIVELSNQNLIEKQKSPLEFFVTEKSV